MDEIKIERLRTFMSQRMVNDPMGFQLLAELRAVEDGDYIISREGKNGRIAIYALAGALTSYTKHNH